MTLDTTRADAVAPESAAETPNLAALVSRGTRFRFAYATAPMTLPSHASLLTGLYPSEHGVHENSRALAANRPLLAEELHAAGYATAAFVSAFVLDRQFGLARGFDLYDDAVDARTGERTAAETTDRALRWLASAPAAGLFLWVHYYDAHAPYAPPEPYRARFATDPYRGELAYVDAQLGRLLAGLSRRAGGVGWRIVVVGDHGEGRGEHGEAQHGNLLYQGTMRVPLVLAGEGVATATVETPVSGRRVHDTILAWAGLAAAKGLLAPVDEVVVGEAMKPFLSYGWQPQVMAVEGHIKAIHAGRTEVYDVVADPQEQRDLGAKANLGRATRAVLRDYPLPAAPAPGAGLPDETVRRLAALGYAASNLRPRVRRDAPSPRAMTQLFADLDLGSGLFVRGEYTAALPVFGRIAARDPHNPTAAMYLAVAQSMLGHDEQALRWFRTAAAEAPDSLDLRLYEALHFCKRESWREAEPLLVSVLAQDPGRLPALGCLAEVRAHEGRLGEAIELLERVTAAKGSPGSELLRLGELRMEAGDTTGAIAALERARGQLGPAFHAHLELGVLYLAAHRFAEARDSLDRVPATDPEHAMVLFKRAQVSVLLGEPDRRERVRQALAGADAATRPLVEREPLFHGLL